MDKEPERYYDWMLWKMRQETQKQNDVVDSPLHYNQGNIECIDYIKDSMGLEGFTYYCEGNAKKYLHRFRSKNQVEDLRKATVYLQWLTEALEDLQQDGEQLEFSF
jgi:hypothetical protein